MRAAALPPGRNRQESRHGKAPPVHLHERRTRRPNRRSPALNRPRPKWKPSCESRSSTTGRGTLPRSAGSSTASRSRNDAGRRKNRDSVWSAAYRPYRTRAVLDAHRKAQGIPKEVAGPAEKQEQKELGKEPPSKGTRPTGRPRPSDNTPDPSRGPVGIDRVDVMPALRWPWFPQTGEDHRRCGKGLGENSPRPGAGPCREPGAGNPKYRNRRGNYYGGEVITMAR